MDLDKVRTVAVVGISDRPERDSYRVARYLQEEAGYRIIPVNPTLAEVLGEKCYPDLLSIPPEVGLDVVDVFRKPEAVPEIAEQAIRRGARVLWLQKGIVHEEAAARAREAGLEVVMDRCLMVEHQHWREGKKQ